MKCKFLTLGRWRNTLQQADIPVNYMTLSDHLDMVGVTLMASWTKTRKANGDVLQAKVDNTIRPWKAGKFMPVTQRGWSINSFALSKVWFRSKCVELRVCDIKKLTSSCKSWLYQDMLVKPEEMILHRPHQHGGLGLHPVKYKAMAGYITTFIQTAANPKFQSNLLHSLLYRKHVLGEDVPGAPNPPPPYLTPELFSTIRKVKEETDLNIVKMSEKDWSRFLTEEYITMSPTVGSDQRDFIPCKSELASPATDWSLSWAACRQPGVPPELASFLWRMMLNLLCTQSKLYRMGTTQSPECKMPGCNDDGTLEHELLFCSKNNGVGQKLMNCLQQSVPGLQPDAALRLEHGDIGPETSLPLTLVTAIILQSVWKEREAKTSVRPHSVRADMEQYINLLRKTRHTTTTAMLESMLDHLF